ncbi:MAG: hypothetical protein QHH19_02520 [Candidatus Thermoplasmatota archaeon]|nr:hypothetical protein [Candidatus Thermoplasmatota archaeon]
MVTISHVVQEILNRQVFLQEAIEHNIVSFNRLAENIKPDIEAAIGKKVKLSAIVMALRRQAEKLEKTTKRPSFDYFRETILKTDVCYVIVEASPTALKKIQSLYYDIDFKKGGIFNVTQGNYEVGIITNQRYKEQLLDLLSEEKILNVVENLVVISLTYSKDFLFTPGIMYNILRFVAWENINIISIILTFQELSLVISRDDTVRCYNILERLVKTSKNTSKDK